MTMTVSGHPLWRTSADARPVKPEAGAPRQLTTGSARLRPGTNARMRRRAALPVMAVLATACASTSESLPVVAVSDSAGVRVVESYEPQWNDGESWSVPSTPRVTIGVLDGAEEYQLFGVVAAARQSDGGFGHFLEGIFSVAGGGVVVERAAQVFQFNQFRQAMGGGGLDLAIVFAQFGFDVGEAEEIVEFGLGFEDRRFRG